MNRKTKLSKKKKNKQTNNQKQNYTTEQEKKKSILHTQKNHVIEYPDEKNITTN